MLIDQHYYAIASKATLLQPKDMPVPAKKFEDAFGIPWEQALRDGLVYNALDACKKLGVDADALDGLWASAKKAKFGGGFYCGLVTAPGKAPIYVFNGFFMSMRGKYVQPGAAIHCECPLPRRPAPAPPTRPPLRSDPNAPPPPPPHTHTFGCHRLCGGL